MQSPPATLQLFGILTDDRVLTTDPNKLPPTGVPTEFEARASRIFIPPMMLEECWYGTRCQTVLAVRRDGRVELRERALRWVEPPAKAVWDETRLEFSVDIGCDTAVHQNGFTA